MEINAMMSAQLASLQQTLQMSILDRAMNTGAAGVVEMMEQLPEQQAAPAAHPYKGQVIDIQA
ncbi:polyribonucleotide nucleotidyltransferase [Lysinibacillus sp. 2017]|uniref:putative motility protein n=1 Tax=unclassified Lysinibacillus TaxID=2636778 RepID=UPI000D5286AD|nr:MULTISPECIES: putative motility protein [unclassified Lysinibacillus]AWE06105.1 polyribonucleotide nucleotidyltransferase [Lysinibacillus sp. 2017]TGN29912.1 putative motility protein [Lysinibacillus sp. S2017]